MKRAFTHKVDYFPSCAADNNALAKLSGGKLPGELANTLKTNSPEVSRRTRASATMIGLAISMGASSVLLPNQSDEAIAAEPIAVEPSATTSTALEAAMGNTTAIAELQPAVSNRHAEVLKVAIPDQAPRLIETHVQAERLQLAPTFKVDEASRTTSNSFYAKSLPETQIQNIAPVGSTVKPLKAGEPEQITQLYKVDSSHLQPSAPTQLSPQLEVGQSVSFPSKVNDLLKATQETATEQLRYRSSNDLAQLKFEESTNQLATPRITTREFSVSLKPLTNNATEFAKTTKSATPTVPKPVVIEPQQQAVKTVVYQVQPGDTLEEIAEAYSVTPKQLIRANKIDNPNIIQINQPLIIPPVNSTSLVSQIQPTSVSGSLASQSELSNTKINQTSFGTGVLPAVLKQPLSSTTSFPATATLVSTVAGNALPKPKLLIAQEPNSEDNSSNSPLIADVSQLNQQYQAESQPNTNNKSAIPPAVTLPVSIPPNSGNLKQQESIQAQAIQATSQFSYTDDPIVIPVPRPLSESESQQPVQVQQESSPSVSIVKPATGAITIPVPSPQVAAAPTEPSNYNPKIQTPIGDTVSPDLPAIQIPIPAPDSNSPTFQGYIWPAKGVFTSGYGRRWGRMHKGIDIAAPIGTPIFAVAPGIVRRSGWNSGGYGNLVEIQHPDGSTTRYAHNSRLWVAAGQPVQQGQQIAEMGSTGHSTGPHLHFEIHAYGKGAVNPVAYLQRRAS